MRRGMYNWMRREGAGAASSKAARKRTRSSLGPPASSSTLISLEPAAARRCWGNRLHGNDALRHDEAPASSFPRRTGHAVRGSSRLERPSCRSALTSPSPTVRLPHDQPSPTLRLSVWPSPISQSLRRGGRHWRRAGLLGRHGPAKPPA